jgi:hypothetical protein
MEKIGQMVLKKGTSLVAKKVLNKQFDENKGRAAGGEWVSKSLQDLW